MNEASEKPRRPVRRNCSIYRVHYGLPREPEMARPLPTADSLELQAYEKQVAGHTGTCDQRYLGLLQCNGTVLKPLLKPSARREVDFYELLASTEDPDLLEFRGYVPKYYGCRRFTYNGFEQEYIVLEDVVEGMAEPCIMDVKIGRETWDEFAPADKIARERGKYASREEYGFCIPGYQVHRLPSGQLLRRGKECGKRLRGRAVVDAIRTFLNGDAGCAGGCRALLLRLLAPLWRLRRWAGRQRALRPAACSLLLAYDAAALRAAAESVHRHRLSDARRGSAHSLHDSASFSGNSFPTDHEHPKLSSPWSEALQKIEANHSFEHSYEDKLSQIKQSYRATLGQMSRGAPARGAWCAVKVIDFAHAHVCTDARADPGRDPGRDPGAHPGADFAAGVAGLIGVLEALLAETDHQTV